MNNIWIEDRKLLKYKLFFRNQLNNIISSLAFSYVLVFFAPLDFYYSNKEDVWYDFSNIFGGIFERAIMLAVILLLLLVLLSLIPQIGKRLSEVVRHIVFIFMIAAYIQGNFIRIPYGTIDGTPIVWKDYWLQDVTSVVFWIGISTLSFIAVIKIERAKIARGVNYIQLFLVLVCTFTLVVEFALGDGITSKCEKRSTIKNEWVYSKEKNFNILVMDSLDSRVFVDLMDTDAEFRGMMDELDGFTFYRDTMGCYNLTDYSVPVILTGELYLGQSTYGEFIENAYSRSPLLNRLKKNGWSNNIYVNVALPQGGASDLIDNLSEIRLEPIYEDKFIKDVYKTVAFRYAPSPLKRFYYDSFFEVGANRTSKESISEESLEAFKWENLRWKKEYENNGIQLVDDKVFHYYHIQGIHPPRQYHSDFEFTPSGDEVDLEEGEMLCFKIVESWIEYLKEKGVYDNSIIVIMGDHGAWEYEAEGNVSQAPILLIKGYDEKHDLYVNELPISYLDLQGGFDKLLDGETSYECFDQLAGDDFNVLNNLTAVNGYTFNRSDATFGRYRLFYFSYLMNEMQQNTIGGPFFEGLSGSPVYIEDGITWTDNVYGG